MRILGTQEWFPLLKGSLVSISCLAPTLNLGISLFTRWEYMSFTRLFSDGEQWDLHTPSAAYVTWPLWILITQRKDEMCAGSERFGLRSQWCGWAFLSCRHSTHSQRQAFESLLSCFSISVFTESTVSPKLNNKASVQFICPSPLESSCRPLHLPMFGYSFALSVPGRTAFLLKKRYQPSSSFSLEKRKTPLI